MKLAQIGAEMNSANMNHSQTATIVCLKNVSGNNLSGESLDNYYEHNISLSSSNYANTITNSWP
jgi:hypothetical protein